MTNSVDATDTSEAQVTEVQASEFALARKIVQDFSKAVTNIGFYLPNNPLVQRSKTELHEEMTHFLETRDIISFEVTDREILYKDNSLYDNDDKAHSIAFLLYRDGLRLISFHKGLSLEELNCLLQITSQGMKNPEEETEIVSSLWNADFSNITYIALDTFLDEDAPVEAADMGETGGANAGTPFPSYSQVLKEAREAAASEPTEPGESTAVSEPGLTQQRAGRQLFGTVSSEEIRAKVQSMAQFSPLSTLGDILLDLFELEKDPSDRTHLLSLFEQCVVDLASQGEFKRASEIISKVRDTLGKFAAQEGHFHQLLGSLLERISSAFWSKEMRGRIEEGLTRQPTVVLNFLELFGPTAVPLLIELIPAAGDVSGRASLRSLLSRLASYDISKLRAAISNPDPPVAREAVTILGRIGDPKSVEMLRCCLEHYDVSVRLQAVRALRQISDSRPAKLSLELSRDVDTLALEFLRDENSEVRILATRTIDISKDASFRLAIQGMLANGNFSSKPTREKIAVIDVLKTAKSDDVVSSLAPFFRGGFFRRREEDSVIMAIIRALASIGTEAAKKLLEKGSRSRTKTIAAECSRVLKRFPKQPIEGESR